MKSIITICLIGTTVFSTFGQGTKYGALAIDKSNGFYYGWAYDYNTLAEAENRALSECKNKGGNCQVVLVWSGAGCAAYRVIDDNVGTAYGWGIAKTKEEADAIALRECMQRSNGNPAQNYVWACNSADPTPFRELFNAGNAKDVQHSNSIESEVLGSLSFNGQTMGATGDCIEGSTVSIVSDDEKYFLVVNNLSSGSSTVNADFYTNGCTSCLAIQFQDLDQEKIYVAINGSVTKVGNSLTVNVTVKELLDMISGTGQKYTVKAKIICED